MMHAASTRAMPRDTLHTEAWQAAALPRTAPQRGPSGRGTASGAAGCHGGVAADGVTLSHKEDAHGRGCISPRGQGGWVELPWQGHALCRTSPVAPGTPARAGGALGALCDSRSR